MTNVEEAVLGGLASAEEMGQRVLLPEVRSLSELFSRIEEVHDLGSYKSRPVHVWDVPDDRARTPAGGRAELSSFVSVRRGTCLDVDPAPGLAALLERNMLLCDGYVINFGITVRGDGTALVTAGYNRISGSRWIAIVPAAEVPGAAG